MNPGEIFESIKAKTGYRELFFMSAAFVLILMISVHGDYGLTNDEPIHQAHGEAVLDFYRGTDSTAALSPIDSTGNLVETFSSSRDENFRGMNFFGGFFDLTVNYLHSFFPKTNIYDFRHLINALFGFLMFFFAGLTAKEIGGWKTALIAFAFAVLSPRLFGHSFANPKDIPFAAAYIIGIHQIIRFVKHLPEIRISNLIFLALITGISIAIRVSGLLLIAYLIMSVFVFWATDFFKTRRIKTSRLVLTTAAALSVSFAGYIFAGFLWPYAGTDFWGPVKVLQKVSSFSVFNAYELFQGKWYNAWEIPLSYVPVWIWISSPVFIQLGIIALPFVFHRRIKGNKNVILYSLLLFFAAFPVIYIMVKHSNVYNGIRHLLFVFPVLAVVTALAWQQILKAAKPTAVYYTLTALLIASMIQPAVWSFRAHPYEAMYFSPLTGGNLAVFGRYETDYWGISTKEAVEKIAEMTDSVRAVRPVKIKMYYGDRMKVENYSRNFKNLEYIAGNAEYGWDYEIVYAAAAKFNHRLIEQWPPENTVFQIKAAGLPLCAVVKNKYSGLTPEEIAERYPTEENFISLSLDYYNKGDYVNCIIAARKALEINPGNVYALNNTGAAANALHLYDYAYGFLLKAVEADSSFVLAINNLKVAFDNAHPETFDRTTLLNNTLNAYKIGAYDYCVKYSKILVNRDKNDAIAWNNLCSAYNALGEYKKAMAACRKAVAIAPDFELAKNNLRYAEERGKY